MYYARFLTTGVNRTDLVYRLSSASYVQFPQSMTLQEFIDRVEERFMLQHCREDKSVVGFAVYEEGFAQAIHMRLVSHVRHLSQQIQEY